MNAVHIKIKTIHKKSEVKTPCSFSASARSLGEAALKVNDYLASVSSHETFDSLTIETYGRPHEYPSNGRLATYLEVLPEYDLLDICNYMSIEKAEKLRELLAISINDHNK